MESHPDLWHGRRVLVTGCTGFLGTAVTRELLACGAAVAGLVRERQNAAPFASEISAGQFHIVQGRVEDAVRLHTAMALHEVAAVFHLATAEASGNDRGTAALLRAAALYHPKVPVVVARPAARLRLAGEDAAGVVPVGVAQFGEVFGPGDRRETGVVPRTVAALLRGEQSRAGDGPSRDFLFVRDAARACLAVAEAVGREGESCEFAFRSGWQHTDRELLELLRTACAGEPPPDGEADPPANPLGWQPSVTLADALAETIAWHRENSLGADVQQPAKRKAA